MNRDEAIEAGARALWDGTREELRAPYEWESVAGPRKVVWRERAAAVLDAIGWAEPGDEHHTMEELYLYRMLYNAHAVNEWYEHGTYPVVKSWNHSDGKPCFGGGWFIVVATLPTGQVSNHYEARYWDLFAVPDVPLPPEYDGHTPAEAALRLYAELPVAHRCATCGQAIEKYEHTSWNGAEDEVLDTWWSHLFHPADGHDAVPASKEGGA